MFSGRIECDRLHQPALHLRAVEALKPECVSRLQRFRGQPGSVFLDSGDTLGLALQNFERFESAAGNGGWKRIREELRAGKSVHGAVSSGFDRAFWTVFDAHVTNLVAGIVLYSYGTGPIRGFAVTLIIGVVANLFTSVWLSRAMFDFLVQRRSSATLSI